MQEMPAQATEVEVAGPLGTLEKGKRSAQVGLGHRRLTPGRRAGRVSSGMEDQRAEKTDGRCREGKVQAER